MKKKVVKAKRENPGANDLRRFWNVAKQTGGFAYDFECVDDQGRPTTEAMAARPVLLSLATGKRRPYKALVLPWDDLANSFLRGLLMQPDLVAVAHYQNYDLLVAHWIGCIDIHDVKARISDTRLLCWLYNEEEDLGLKTQVWRKLGYRMVGFKEATIDSEFNKAICIRQSELKGLQKEANERVRVLKREARDLIQKKKKALDERWPSMKGLLLRADFNAMKRDAAAEINQRLAEKLEEVQTIVVQRTIEIRASIQKNERLGFKLFKKYALDDGLQCWRLYLKMLRWVEKANMTRWLEIEEANHHRALIMAIDGALLNQKIAEDLKGRSEPLLIEFEAAIHNFAKREFNVRSNKELPEVLYKDLGIEPPEGTLPSKVKGIVGEPWAWSTKTEVLLRIEHPIAQAILDYRSVNTIYTNFMCGLLRQAQEDPQQKSRVHVIFNSTGTRTGRWSSSTG